MAEGYTTEDWRRHYQQQDLPWDLGDPHPWLVKVLPRASVAGRRVLVPGAGVGHDAAYLASLGAQVTALDIAPEARTAHHARYGGGVDYQVRDFFGFAPEEPFDLLVEHTCFPAIAPSRREAFAEACARCVRPGGEMVMVVLLLPGKVGGPPFGVTWSEFQALFQGRFDLVAHGQLMGVLTARDGAEGFAQWRRKV